MSLQNILDPATQDESWANLYCNSLTTNTLFMSGNIQENTVQLADLTVTRGNITSLQVVRSLKYEILDKLVELSVAFRLAGAVAPLNASGVSEFRFELDLGENMDFPDASTQLMFSSGSASIINSDGVNALPASVAIRKLGNQDTVDLDVIVAGDVSVLVPSNSLWMNLTLRYRVA